MPKTPGLNPSSKPTPVAKMPIKRNRAKSRPQTLDWQTLDAASIGGDDSLQRELLTYQEHLAELLEHRGEYVLINGIEVAGFFPTLDAALELAAERFGAEPALIKQVTAEEPVHPAGGLAS